MADSSKRSTSSEEKLAPATADVAKETAKLLYCRVSPTRTSSSLKTSLHDERPAMPSVPQTDGADSVSLDRPSFLHDLRAFSREWIRLNGLDVLVMLAVGGLSFGIYHAPNRGVRTFPITFDGSGDIVYPEWAYPYRGWIVPAWVLGAASILGPVLVYLVAQIQVKSAWDASNAIMGTLWAVTLGTFFHVVIKQLIGGFRPYFLDVCRPDVSLAETHNRSGLNAVGFQQVMYTTDICTQTNASRLKDAVTSFPSGHSTAAFAGFVFLLLWLNAKLKVWADHKPAFWKLGLVMAPLLVAVTMACSLTIDAAHNWYDIVGGSMIGTVTAVASYRCTYAAVLDWRFNHLPLRETEPFAYDCDIVTQTVTRSVGWGVGMDGSSEPGEGERRGFWTRYPMGASTYAGETAVEGRPKRRALYNRVDGLGV
ncbi:phosphatidic acid phosphatase beta [Metarhizium album ARSEF 1941]|uniref:Phosphatidic acid phosphatase beta n=1 Tax=Metarhizium album (strain ARSEF 1941) TaxID=1081103 RepID=A0A0B2WUS7_METAS|nr:phosphatidic acid phosphatase beta [Metarhizium album ARSEF 1941]KHN97232.1 phosphatidic acid phosphatase beta [Metarhizium album ARSEF 1941]